MTAGRRPIGGGAAAITALVLAFLVLNWSVILLAPHESATSEAKDQDRYHLPVILTMIEQWPRVDLVNYRSTTSPGYHLAMAAIAAVTGPDRTLLQLASSLGTLALVLVAWRYARAGGAWEAACLVAPLLASSYVLGASIWLTTDNWALLFVALALGGAVFAAPTAGALARCGLWATLAVFVRQIHLWAAGAPLLAALPVLAGRSDPAERRRLLLALPALAAPFVLMAAFYLAWGGLTPPAYADKHDAGANPAAIPFILALFAGYGLFFVPAWGVTLRTLLPRGRAVWVVTALVLVAGFAIDTAFEPKPGGRWGGPVWELVRRMPALGTRSLVLPLAGAAGVLLLARAWEACRERGRNRAAGVLLLSTAGWMLAQAVNTMAWQRYCEPMVLLVLAWITVLAAPGERIAPRGRLGPLLLAAILLVLSGLSVYRPAFLGP